MLFASPLLLSLLYYIVFWGVGWEDLPYLFTSTSADVRYHRTTAWQGDSPFGLTRLARANIYTRTVAQDSPVLLLTRAEVEQSYDRTAREYTVVSWTRVAAVYLYDPSEDRLEVVQRHVGASEWLYRGMRARFIDNEQSPFRQA
jgi:hypothetical protein